LNRVKKSVVDKPADNYTYAYAKMAASAWVRVLATEGARLRFFTQRNGKCRDACRHRENDAGITASDLSGEAYSAFLNLITNVSVEMSPGFNPERSMMQSLPACLNDNDLLLPKMLIVVPAAGLKLRSFIVEL